MKSVEKALHILETLMEYRDGIGVNELSRQISIPAPTTHRILNTLLQNGYVSQEPILKHYKLGTKLLTFSTAILDSLDLRKQALPFLEDIQTVTKESAHLSILDNDEVLFIDRVESHHSVRSISRIGTRAQLHFTASGKAILAFLPPQEKFRILDKVEFKPWLPNTIMSKAALQKELESVCEKGFAIDDEEHTLGGRCVAAPIFDDTGRAVAAISVTGPVSRMSYDLLQNKYSRLVKEAADKISKGIGYYG